MSNEKVKPLSAKRIIFLVLAILIAVFADMYLDRIGSRYSENYVSFFLQGGKVSAYTLIPILYTSNLFVLFGSLAFIGYTADSIIQMFASFGVYVILGPVQSAFKVVKGAEESSFPLEMFILYTAFSMTMLLIMLVPFFLKRFRKVKNKRVEAAMHIFTITVMSTALYAAFRFIAPYIVYGSLLDENTIKKIILMVRDMGMLAPINIAIISIFMIVSRLVFKQEFVLDSAEAAGLNYNPTVYSNGKDNNS